MKTDKNYMLFIGEDKIPKESEFIKGYDNFDDITVGEIVSNFNDFLETNPDNNNVWVSVFSLKKKEMVYVKELRMNDFKE